jgi:phosphatidylinositol-3-phosphatase
MPATTKTSRRAPTRPNRLLYQEAGVTGPLNDNDLYPSNIVNSPDLSGLLAASGQTWRAHEEDSDPLDTARQNFNNPAAGGTITNNVAAKSEYGVPLASCSGTSASYTNPYNGSNQYNYAAKHDPMVFFTDTNGGNNPTSSNPQSQNMRACRSWRPTSPTTRSRATIGSRPTSTTTCIRR